MIKKLFITTLAIGTLGLSGFLYEGATVESSLSTFIIRGASPDVMQDQVVQAGGKIIHRHNVIDALTVELTADQQQMISEKNPLLRFFENAKVEISGFTNWSSPDGLAIMHTDNTVTWALKNLTDKDVYLSDVQVTWPQDNGMLVKLKVAGQSLKLDGSDDELNVNLTANSASIELLDKTDVDLGAGKREEVELEFSAMSSQVDADYEIILTFDNGETVSLSELNTRLDGSILTTDTKMIYKIEDGLVEWTTLSATRGKRTVESLTLDWPDNNGKVTEIKLNGEVLDETAIIVHNAEIKINQIIEIDSDDKIELKVTFESLTSVTDSDYNAVVLYDDGSAQRFATMKKVVLLSKAPDTFYPTIVNANLAHDRLITGAGLTVAIIDTGINQFKFIEHTATLGDRAVYTHSVIGEADINGNVEDDTLFIDVEDVNGHGTHIASIIANSAKTQTDTVSQTAYNGIAPDANLLIVKAFDKYGSASYTDILNAIEYVVENKDALNVKVLNLSFSAKPSSYYWDDPINLAVMKAWQAGIVVVSAAGNRGPEAMTIGVPGNNPYVLTVGAISDNYTPSNLSDDFVTSFSSAGPTYEGFPKPELVAPGGHIQGYMHERSFITNEYGMHVRARDDAGATDVTKNWDSSEYFSKYFTLSGSSQSTAIVSGIAALMLQNDPSLTPDDVKCRLMYTARLAVKEDGDLAYSIFQQGAGLVNAIDAIDTEVTGCGNTSLDINKELAGEENFVGPVRYDNNLEQFYIPDSQGLSWDGVYNSSQLWGNSRFSSNSQLWGNSRFSSDSQLWGNSRFNSDSQLWGNSRFNSDSQLWGNSRFNSDSQLWGNSRFGSDSQLWGNSRFNSDSTNSSNVHINWVNHE